MCSYQGLSSVLGVGSTSSCGCVMMAAGDGKIFGGYLVGLSTRLCRLVPAPLAQIGAAASSSLSFLASFSKSMGARRRRRLLRFCPRSAHPAQSRFHRRLPPCQRKFPQPALRRKRSAPVCLSNAHRSPRKPFHGRPRHSLHTFSPPTAHRCPFLPPLRSLPPPSPFLPPLPPPPPPL